MFCRQCGSQLPLAAPYCDVCGSPAAPPRPVAPHNPQPTRPLHIDDEFKTLLAVKPKSKNNWIGWAFVGLLAGCALLISGAGIAYILMQPSPDRTANANAERASSPSNAPFVATPTPRPSQRPVERAPTPAPVYLPTPDLTFTPTPIIVNQPLPPPFDVVAHQMTVGAGQFRYYSFTVADVGRAGVLTGRFNARGGDNDINVAIIPAEQMANFQQPGRIFTHYYHSGYIQEANVNRTLPPGDYFLIFDNRKALIIGKTVNAFFQLRYE